MIMVRPGITVSAVAVLGLSTGVFASEEGMFLMVDISFLFSLGKF